MGAPRYSSSNPAVESLYYCCCFVLFVVCTGHITIIGENLHALSLDYCKKKKGVILNTPMTRIEKRFLKHKTRRRRGLCEEGVVRTAVVS